ncbi:guanine nucleotide-binding protein alpha-3 subunit [Pyrenophora tritici-repentis Pt-1C-BFP]|uniref:Guanine nucleotide-binding protein alpha-3 subunit n=1 Tax=Pyrenophora tritici-repentis (strain Pt-1C-BFP) TaxID=426418 RepID=B2W424_PYRTR|nr:guanine nucleotide-binding protein alpha-3 subunit [Pyrenophora tritici-repentis Pt-1C-BFP]EDU48131.1 guanine nucleotide-binding protein alpha-3 subunit [Pyrenophora tritici-repentis Pt-1C-BFP]
MGICMSTNNDDVEQKKRSQAIDRKLEEDSRRLRRECKILLLGSGESGKSTIVKQMKIIHQNGYTQEELAMYRLTIYKNVIDCAKALIGAMRQFEVTCENPANTELCDYLLEYTVDPDPEKPLDMRNRMMESLVLFDSVVNSRWFMRTSIILFLNKVDLFKAKLARSPLGNYFPDYSGGNDVNRAAKYLLWRFNQVNRAHLNLYPHLTQATDTSHIRLVFAAVKETILQNALKDSGIL